MPGPEPTALLHALFGLFRDLKSGLMAEMAADDRGAAQAARAVAPFHLMLLRHCAARPGQAQQDLVQHSGRDKGQVARVVKELEAAGLLVRVADATDRRRLCLSVTEAGLARVRCFDAAERRLASRAFAALPPAEQARWAGWIAVCRDALGPTIDGGAAAPARPDQGDEDG